MEAVIFNQSCWILDLNGNDAARELEELLIISGFSVFGSLDHHFKPQGYTKIWLLGESHFALHSFPEKNALYIELSSCVKEMAVLFWDYLNKWLNEYSKIMVFNSENIHQL